MHKATGARDVDGEPSASRVFIVLYKDFFAKISKEFYVLLQSACKGIKLVMIDRMDRTGWNDG